MSAPWLYINLYKGKPSGTTRETELSVQQERNEVGENYVLLVDLPHLLVIQWTQMDSLHIYIHEDLIDE